MRKLLTVSLVLCLAISLAAGAQTAGKAHVKLRGTVTVVDAAAKTFTCHWKTGDMTFKTTDKTQYWKGGKEGSWADLKTGDTVSVGYHDEGADHVAETVRIAASKPANK
jgi:hypothetical protein